VLGGKEFTVLMGDVVLADFGDKLLRISVTVSNFSMFLLGMEREWSPNSKNYYCNKNCGPDTELSGGVLEPSYSSLSSFRSALGPARY